MRSFYLLPIYIVYLLTTDFDKSAKLRLSSIIVEPNGHLFNIMLWLVIFVAIYAFYSLSTGNYAGQN